MTPLEGKIIQELKLDDYVNNDFHGNGNRLFLYIGYYLTSKKVGAAHSPLVCFPGQGWLLSNLEERTVKTPEGEIHLVKTLAANTKRRLLVLYWFQSFEKTSPGTFYQKVYTLLAKYFHQREDNAFVRIMIPIDNIPEEDGYRIGVGFIKAFYPLFIKHIKENFA